MAETPRQGRTFFNGKLVQLWRQEGVWTLDFNAPEWDQMLPHKRVSEQRKARAVLMPATCNHLAPDWRPYTAPPVAIWHGCEMVELVEFEGALWLPLRQLSRALGRRTITQLISAHENRDERKAGRVSTLGYGDTIRRPDLPKGIKGQRECPVARIDLCVELAHGTSIELARILDDLASPQPTSLDALEHPEGKRAPAEATLEERGISLSEGIKYVDRDYSKVAEKRDAWLKAGEEAANPSPLDDLAAAAARLLASLMKDQAHAHANRLQTLTTRGEELAARLDAAEERIATLEADRGEGEGFEARVGAALRSMLSE